MMDVFFFLQKENVIICLMICDKSPMSWED